MTKDSIQLSAISNQYPYLLATSYWLLNKRGFALISMIIILSLLGIAAGVAASFAYRLKASRRQVATEDELKALTEAILGNPRQYSKEGRSNFGYLGNMGQIPTTLQHLYMKTVPGYATQPDYALGASDQGAGWAGPYITPTLREDLAGLLKDPYGNTYTYTTTPYQRASDNEWVSARIRSFGTNKTDDGGAEDDRQIEILQKETLSTVSGYVTYPDGTAINGATVTLYYPSGGSVNSTSTTTNASGLFSFSNIPFGTRTITVTAPAAGTLKFGEGSALATGSGSTYNNLSFNITNWGAAAVTVNSIKLNYTIPPPDNNAYFEQVYVGGTHVFDYTNDSLNDNLTDGLTGNNKLRGPSGTTITFASTSISPSTASTTKRILVAADSVLLPNVILSPKGGGTLDIRYLIFRRNQTSGGSNPEVPINDADADGQPSFTVNLYNSATVVLTQSFTARKQP